MADFSNLAKNLRKKSAILERNVDLLIKDVAKTVLLDVTAATPVDTGQAKSNWQVNLNSPASGTRPPYVPGKKGSTALDNIIATAEMGNRKIDQYVAGQEIHITNNIDYISGLNDGSISKQAPPNYVQSTIIESIAKVQRAGFTILHDIKD